jgi:hypothetical protein
LSIIHSLTLEGEFSVTHSVYPESCAQRLVQDCDVVEYAKAPNAYAGASERRRDGLPAAGATVRLPRVTTQFCVTAQ